MEKKRPHYNLSTIQHFIKEKKYFITRSAYLVVHIEKRLHYSYPYNFI